MSSITSSIWHTKKEKPTEDKTIFAQHKSFRDGSIECFMWERQEFTDAIRKDVIAWCYLDNLIALETELERTRKALDVALCSLQDIAESDGDFITGASTPLDEHEYADMMLKEIKRQMKIKTALEQKE